MDNDEDLCGLFYCREDHGEIKITNNLVYDITSTGGRVGAFLAVTPATESDNEIRVYNNTVYNCTANDINSSLIRVLDVDKVQLYNNVLSCSGSRPQTLGAIGKEPTSTVREFIFNDVNPDTITASGSSPGSFVTDGFEPGMELVVTGTSNNDGRYLIDSVAATTLTLDAGETLTAEGPIGSGMSLVALTFLNSNSSGNVIDDSSGSDNDVFNTVIQTTSGILMVLITGYSTLDSAQA